MLASEPAAAGSSVAPEDVVPDRGGGGGCGDRGDGRPARAAHRRAGRARAAGRPARPASGRCATTTTALRRPSSRIASAMTRSVSSSRCAVGSSSSTHGRSASTIRARASRARSPADSVAPSSPSGASRPRGSSRTRTSSATSRSASHSVGVGRVGAGEAQVVGDGAGHEVRPLRQPGDLRLPGRRRRRATRRTVTEPPEAGTSPASDARAGWTCRTPTGRSRR